MFLLGGHVTHALWEILVGNIVNVACWRQQMIIYWEVSFCRIYNAAAASVTTFIAV